MPPAAAAGPGPATTASTPAARVSSTPTASATSSVSVFASLDRLGLRLGEPIRFRKLDAGRWWSGKMAGVAADGSVTIYDADGAARSLHPERIEVRRPGSRGRLTWQLLSDVAVTWEQLELW